MTRYTPSGGIQYVVQSLGHRGRNNLLACLLNYPPVIFFQKVASTRQASYLLLCFLLYLYQVFIIIMFRIRIRIRIRLHFALLLVVLALTSHTCALLVGASCKAPPSSALSHTYTRTRTLILVLVLVQMQGKSEFPADAKRTIGDVFSHFCMLCNA